MSEIYRSQFRMPLALFEKLKSEAGKSKRSANAELVARLERSLTDGSNELDMRIIYETLERLSLRNPNMRYSFGVNFGGQLDERPAEISRGAWTLGTDPSRATEELLLQQNSNVLRATKANK
ncbi:Arc family DNA-binding protein [Pseudoduganella sp. FT55W]|uniref:Arc family DNA-binding protein n=1 Tax=Duganella rivi TaxID=2666083 RepID=A0A7X4GQZ1_9BURK|nr:Arc family DNA-binding protein [Duganella rivi]MYM67052.1 Arc family DNA-binding protein [Duganella rivi]